MRHHREQGAVVPTGCIGGHSQGRLAELVRHDHHAELGQVAESQLDVPGIEPWAVGAVAARLSGLGRGEFVRFGQPLVDGLRGVDLNGRPVRRVAQQRDVANVALGKCEDECLAIRVVADLADELNGGPAIRRRQRDARGRARRYGRGLRRA